MRSSRLRALLGLLLVLACHASTASAQAPKRYNGTGKEVMLQGFHWTSYDAAKNGNKAWYVILKDNAGAIKDSGFDYVWFPPPSASAATDNAYLPTEWYKFKNGYGDEQGLRDAIQALKPARAICDIVINHRCGVATDGPDFKNPEFADNAAAIVSGDDGKNIGKGAREERHRDGSPCEGNDAARDLDHTNASVQAKIKEFHGKLKDLGFAGWRYDQVRGYNGYYVGLYNDASDPAISVGEFWDNQAQKVVDWIDETGGKSMAFDFPTRDALVGATLRQDYGRLKTSAGKPPGVIGMWPEMAVTFIENHDTEAVRDSGNKRFPDDKIMQGYAYILTHPGIPCVFWRHFFDQGDDQKQKIVKLIALRKEMGITSGSGVWIEPDTNGKYAAKVDDKIAVKIGPAAWSPGNGWVVVVDGPDYAVWKKQ
jgi:alpha-amylase